MRAAIIDMGTNTFNLLVGEKSGEHLTALYQEKIFVKIGKDGISNGMLTDDAIERALTALTQLKKKAERYNVKLVRASATSAIRSAKNASVLLEKIKNDLGIEVTVIDGNREALLIYTGVNTVLGLSKKPVLIVDIGGGSVEFIIANNEEIFWKESYEIGAQRLVDRFHNSDPISTSEQHHLQAYLESVLDGLANQIYLLEPETMIGCAGTFSTIKTIHCLQNGTLELISKPDYPISIPAYLAIHEELLSKNLRERIAIPGMLEERADMIVVASCIVSYLVENYNFKKLRITTAALKDGLLWETLNNANNATK
jgi:exopolyphosphatase/guanosine-5'-triphosphate,3'-diphosphate pyrophosphatase